MIRITSLFWLALILLSGFATFTMKYAVQDIEEELNRVRKQTVTEQQQIHVLRAEWTALNQPERLAELNRRFLSLAAITPKQLQSKIEEIPLRPVPEPSAPLVAVVPEPPPLPTPAAASPPSAAPSDVQSAGDTIVAATAAKTVPNLHLIAAAEAAPAVAPATALKPPGKPDPRPPIAKARPSSPSQALDRLVGEIAEAR